ncbi:hypothetical protein ES707_01035 [subsurface metagenome]
MITEEQLQKVREPIPFTPTKRLKRDDVLYVTEDDIPHPIYGYAKHHKEYSVIDLRGYRKGHEPRLEISGIYTPNPEDIFRLQTGKLPPYQPTTTGDKLLAEMRRLGVHKAFRIGKPEVTPEEVPAVPEAKPQPYLEKYRKLVEKYPDRIDKHLERAKDEAASVVLGKAFGETVDDFFEREPAVKRRYDEVMMAIREMEQLKKGDNPEDKMLLKVAIEREPLRVAKQWGYEVHRLSPKDIVDKDDYARGYRYRLSKADPTQPYPRIVMARNEGEVAAFLKKKIEGNPARVRFDRADIDSAIAAAKRLKSEKDLYIFATYLGYTIDHRPPLGIQSYIIVRPDGTTETIKPIVGGNPKTPNTYTSLQLFDPSTKEKIITAWQKNRVVFWKYGTIRPRFNDIAVCLKERKVRNLISGKEIAEYLAKSKLGGSNPIPEELDLARTLAIIDSRPKGRIIESKLREEFGDAVIDALRQGRYVVSGSAGFNPPLLVSLKGRELIQGGNPEGVGPKAVVRYKRNYGGGKSVVFVEYEYGGERYITGTVVRGTDRSLGWYFGKGKEGLREANRIALLSDEEFSKAEDLKKYSWREILKSISEAKPPVEEVKEGSNPHLLPENVPEEDFTTVTDVDSIYDLFSEGKISLRELDRLKDHYYKWYYSPERRTTVLRFYRQPDGTMTIYKQVYVQTYGESGNPGGGALTSKIAKVMEYRRLHPEYIPSDLTEEEFRVLEKVFAAVITASDFELSVKEAMLLWATADRGYVELKSPNPNTTVGTCYEDAWRFQIKQEEGILVHGEITGADGITRKHAWVELETGFIYEPQTARFFKADVFKRTFNPKEDARYTVEEAAKQAARKGYHGAWAEEVPAVPEASNPSSEGGNPMGKVITKEEAIGLLERLSMTPGEAARSLVADEAERMEIMQTVQQRVKREQNKWAPMDPREGPPLPRIFAGLRWPWKK